MDKLKEDELRKEFVAKFTVCLDDNSYRNMWKLPINPTPNDIWQWIEEKLKAEYERGLQSSPAITSLMQVRTKTRKQAFDDAIGICDEVAKHNGALRAKNSPQITQLQKSEYNSYKSSQVTAEYILAKLQTERDKQ